MRRSKVGTLRPSEMAVKSALLPPAARSSLSDSGKERTDAPCSALAGMPTKPTNDQFCCNAPFINSLVQIAPSSECGMSSTDIVDNVFRKAGNKTPSPDVIQAESMVYPSFRAGGHTLHAEAGLVADLVGRTNWSPARL